MSQGPFESLLALDAQLRLLRVDLATEAATRWKGLMVRVGSESLLVPQADVSEVIPPPPATLIPNARAWLRGVGNLRGQLLTLVDLKALIGDGHTAPGRLQRTLVVNTQPQWLGFLVDEVVGSRSFDVSDQCEWASTEGDPWMAVTLGALRTPETGALRVISLHKLAASERVRHAGW
ncbi:chemotaxis protein CheW [Polycyclovorans algicola]|uniref:chemotaxis protein CheW n=1 Tax=Polycyclovorans algicola TaxID=616992 RepID=UPI0004A78518|nr:chemotaxis protein CheW [Polycyclovorans algicola]